MYFSSLWHTVVQRCFHFFFYFLAMISMTYVLANATVTAVEEEKKGKRRK